MMMKKTQKFQKVHQDLTGKNVEVHIDEKEDNPEEDAHVQGKTDMKVKGSLRGRQPPITMRVDMLSPVLHRLCRFMLTQIQKRMIYKLNIMERLLRRKNMPNQKIPNAVQKADQGGESTADDDLED